MKWTGINYIIIALGLNMIIQNIVLNEIAEDVEEIRAKQPDTQGNLNTTYQSDSINTKKYTFKTYSPITERNQKNRVKELKEGIEHL